MAEYQVQSKVSGQWAKGEALMDSKKAMIVTECLPIPSQFQNKDGSVKMQDVAKVKFEGVNEPLNLSFNRASIGAMVEAFGSDSKKWVNQVVKVEVEQMRVAGKKVFAIYLIPDGFVKTDNEDGYAVISRVTDDIPTVGVPDNTNSTGEIDISKVPF